MATNPVNLIDAIAVAVPRLARNRSAVMRTGKVLAAPSGGFVNVQVQNGTIQAGYHLGVRAPAANDVVTLLNDGDRWVIVGIQAT